eukprot:CAMPEP_0178658534 /NCGR_PEP_ID=MMETSP0698-20121128/26042_1 /TAXON_ID=265572 /ORGANISM="Extubocellulus spinifer, Strain CCMP396" /LENGTH=395 /DNA_ID=CAMNT_0020300929 /DNA_START=141 /DNA_END=1328 /DNA_ORIENTATION=+
MNTETKAETNQPGGPRTSWGERIRRRRRRSAESAAAATPKAATSPSSPPPSAPVSDGSLLDEIEEGGASILLRRPDQISISYVRPSADSRIGLRLRVSATDAIEIEGKDQEGPLSQVNPLALREGSQHSLTFFAPGDILECVDDVDCRAGKRELCLKEVTDHVRGAQSGPITISVRTNTTDDGMPAPLRQAIAMRDAGTVTPRTGEATAGGTSTNYEKADLGIVFGQQDDLLVIQDLGFFGAKGCAIQKGDIVVGINENICSNVSPEMAQSLLDAVASLTPHLISITAIAADSISLESKSKWASFRRAAVAAGGGTMVGAGAVLMVTPLHPVGHALAIGGVGVLGTEFEAPKRMISSAKGRWSERRKAKESEPEEKDDTGAKESEPKEKMETVER